MGNVDIVTLLLINGALVLVRDLLGNTPLHYCTEQEVCKLLVEQVPKLDNLSFHLTNKAGELPFQNSSSAQISALFSQVELTKLTPTLHIQICSDLHIEFMHKIDVVPKAPYLALLGDIGLCVQPLYRNFLLECAQKFAKVFVILGNHEFYSFNVESSIATTENICASHPNLVFMNRTSLLLEGVRILGCTLWSFIRPEQKDEVDMCLSDYRVIRIGVDPPEITPPDEVTPEWRERQKFIGERRLTSDDTHKWHLEECEWLSSEIARAKNNDEKVLVLTHHAPIYGYGDSSADNLESPIRSAFSTDLTHMFGYPLVSWCYGHTHWYNDVTINGTRVISNPHGYPKEQEEKGYDPYFVVSI